MQRRRPSATGGALRRLSWRPTATEEALWDPGKDHKPEESPVYADVKIETADDSLTYAQINRHNKGKAKNKKDDGLTYAQIKHDSKGKANKKKGL
ncbi:hypothetical protein Q5P01_002493 [Channa striata]|uniref:Uncharacterized protein n=1 Tax=Channa striata TaxID=64152 RepID=A0AA88NPB1_CHASR|nr:hypothetical protein Q5P01_002493 [Channa striata]